MKTFELTKKLQDDYPRVWKEFIESLLLKNHEYVEYNVKDGHIIMLQNMIGKDYLCVLPFRYLFADLVAFFKKFQLHIGVYPNPVLDGCYCCSINGSVIKDSNLSRVDGQQLGILKISEILEERLKDRKER